MKTFRGNCENKILKNVFLSVFFFSMLLLANKKKKKKQQRRYQNVEDVKKPSWTGTSWEYSRDAGTRGVSPAETAEPD